MNSSRLYIYLNVTNVLTSYLVGIYQDWSRPEIQEFLSRFPITEHQPQEGLLHQNQNYIKEKAEKICELFLRSDNSSTANHDEVDIDSHRRRFYCRQTT